MMSDKTQALQQTLIEAQQDPKRPNIAAIYDGAKIAHINARTKVVVTCAKHGDFDILPRDIARRSYLCAECHKESKVKKSDNKAEDLKAAIIKRHGDKFDFSLFHYKDTNTKITLLCKIHNHETTLYPYDVERREHICEKCKSEAMHDLHVSDTEAFIEKAKAIHGERYDYAQADYQGALAPINLICSSHGPFKIPASSHLSGRGCQACGYEQAALKKTNVKQERRVFTPSDDALNSNSIYLQEYVAFRLNKIPVISFDLFGDLKDLSLKEFKQQLRKPAFAGECRLILGTRNLNDPDSSIESSQHTLNSPSYFQIFKLCEAHYAEHENKIDQRRPLEAISFDPDTKEFSFFVNQLNKSYENRARQTTKTDMSNRFFTPSTEALKSNYLYIQDYLSFVLKKDTSLSFALFKDIESLEQASLKEQLRETAIDGECKIILGTRNLGDTSSWRRTRTYKLSSPTYLEVFKVCEEHYVQYNKNDDHCLLESIYLKNHERNNNAYVVFAGS